MATTGCPPRHLNLNRDVQSTVEGASCRALAVCCTMRRHPLGVQPGGNAYLPGAVPPARCGPYLNHLPDAVLVRILGYIDFSGLCTLAQTCRKLCAFAYDDELWRALTLSRFSSSFCFQSSWRDTFRDSLLLASHTTTSIAHGKSNVGDENEKVIKKPLPDWDTRPRKRPRCVRHEGEERLSNRMCVGVYSDVLYHKWRCQSAEIDPSWIQFDNAPRVDGTKVDVDTFRREFEIPGRPAVITGVVAQWEASRKWSREYFVDNFGDVDFVAGGYTFSMRRYLAYADAIAGKCDQPLYLFDPGFALRAPVLASDYSVPPYFSEDLFQYLGASEAARPDYRWLILGPRNSGSSFHKDPNGTSAWNACVRGAKKWFFFPPHIPPPGVYPGGGGRDVTAPVSVLEWFVNFYDEARRVSKGCGAVECVAREGELVFVPSGWWHAVINLEWSVAVTQNFVDKANFRRVARWMEECADQVSGCRDEGHARRVASTFVPRVCAARPELARLLRRSERESCNGAGVAVDGKLDCSNGVDEAEASTRENAAGSGQNRVKTGLWESLRAATCPDAKGGKQFSFGL